MSSESFQRLSSTLKKHNIVGIIGHGKISVFSTLQQQITYEECTNSLYALVPDIAGKLIGIVESESYDIERRIAFLKTTIEEICAGADYSKCENIDDMSEVYAESLTHRLLLGGAEHEPSAEKEIAERAGEKIF